MTTAGQDDADPSVRRREEAHTITAPTIGRHHPPISTTHPAPVVISAPSHHIPLIATPPSSATLTSTLTSVSPGGRVISLDTRSVWHRTYSNKYGVTPIVLGLRVDGLAIPGTMSAIDCIAG
jgi:hypothetical protein